MFRTEFERGLRTDPRKSHHINNQLFIFVILSNKEKESRLKIMRKIRDKLIFFITTRTFF